MVLRVVRKRFWLAALAGLIVLMFTLRRADFNALIRNFQNIDLQWGCVALLTSALSYLCIAAVLYYLLRSMGFDLAFSSSVQITLLSCTLNYLMAVGGLSGVAAKVYLLAREKIPPSNTLSISVVHGFLTNTVAVIFIYLGFFFLYSDYKMNTREIEVGLVVLLVAFLLTWLTIQTIVHESFRRQLWKLILHVGTAVCDKLHHPHWFHRERAQAFFDNFNESMTLLVRNGRRLIVPGAFALLDWMLMFACLKYSFMAVHYPLNNSTLLVGFSVGIFTTLFSVTPASIGLMEGSMAGSFYLLGLDYERALLATLIYRLVYFFLPILVSLLFYRHFFPGPERPKDIQDEPPIG